MREKSPDSTNTENALLDKIAFEHGVNSDLLRELLDIRLRDFPDLDKWGAKNDFEKAVGDFVEKAARQTEQTSRP